MKPKQKPANLLPPVPVPIYILYDVWAFEKTTNAKKLEKCWCVDGYTMLSKTLRIQTRDYARTCAVEKIAEMQSEQKRLHFWLLSQMEHEYQREYNFLFNKVGNNLQYYPAKFVGYLLRARVCVDKYKILQNCIDEKNKPAQTCLFSD